MLSKQRRMRRARFELKQPPAARLAMRAAIAGVVAFGWVAPGVEAAISSSGDITPVPPAAGGAVVGPFRVGNVDVGTMSITTSGGPSPLTNTNSVLIGETLTGIGIVNMSGFGSDWTLVTASADMTVGLFGAGSVNLSNLAFLSVNDDLFIAAQLNSLGEISISGFGTIMDVGDDANIGQRGQAVIEITNGGRLVTDQNIIGDEADGDGRVRVEDPFSLWRTTNTMTIADAGRGLLQILDGGRVESTAPSGNISATIANQAGSTGTVEVVGLGSIWQNGLGIVVGEFGNGRLIVADGGRVSIGTGANLFTIGRQIGSTGYVEVSGAGSLLSAAIAEVGDSGDGTLRILAGGRVVTGLALIGDNSSARGEVLVDGVGSTWEVTGELNVSDPGEGRLTISNGGLVRSSSVTRVAALGRLTLDGGRLEIGGTVGLLNAGVVDGNGAIEALKVDNNPGGRLHPRGAEPLIVTGTLNNLGTIDVQAGTLEVIGPTNNNLDIDARDGATLRFRGAGLDNNPGSQLGITSGTVDVFGLVNNDAGAEIAVGGTAVAVFHDAVTSNGTFFVQPGGAVLLLENLGFTPTSTLALPLRAAASNAVGQVAVSGAVQLDGGLDVSVSGGSLPQVGDRFTFLTAESVGGTFTTATIPHDGGTIQFHPVYTTMEAAIFVAGAGDKTWGVDASGNTSESANWLGGVAPGNIDDKAAFTTIISASRTVAIDRPLTIGSLYFDDDDDYVLQGPGGITLDVSAGNARIDVKALHGTGTHTIDAPIVMNDDTVIDVAGESVLRITEPLSGEGVELSKDGAGTLVLRKVRAGKVSVNAGRVEVMPGSGGATGASVVQALVIRGAPGAYEATVDLADNDLIVEGGDVAAITNYVRSARNSPLGRWRGAGLTSSAAASTPLTTLAVGVVGNDVVVRHTYDGDANVDGRINADDYFGIDSGFLEQPEAPLFSQGDFNYDGRINADDYFLIDSAFLGQGTPLGAAAAIAPAASVPEPGVPEPGVPEPGVACLAMSCVAGALARRRRSHGTAAGAG